MNVLSQWLERCEVLICDGAWGTELSKAGLAPGSSPEALNEDDPGMVAGVARSYVEAGADIVLTNSFGGSPFKLAKAGLAERTEVLNRSAVRISREASGGRALVFGSIGPTGEFMEPLGEVTEAEMVAAFARQVNGLIEGGADGILIETMTDLGEALAAVKAAKDACGLPIAVSMTFDRGGRGFATMMGVTPERAAVELSEAKVDALGTNCGGGIEDVVEIIRAMRASTDLPLWAKPNAGLPQLIGGQTVYRGSPDEMVGHFQTLVEAGARMIGGCCGSTPEHIGRFRAERDRLIGQAAHRPS